MKKSGVTAAAVKRFGLYAWGGPGTIRLLKTKYHDPQIDTASFLQIYDEPYLKKARTLFGVTDMWVTYSWGFADSTEQEDYLFLRKRLKHFQKFNIAAHAYVQGLNVVTAEFSGHNFFCRDARGRLLPYSLGRSFICPNNPETQNFVEARVRRAAAEDVAGVFVDNILFGPPPAIVRQDAVSFFGCCCTYCQSSFKKQFGYALQGYKSLSAATVHDYLRFRCGTLKNFIRRLAAVAHASAKQFGVNLYDPWLHTPELYFGFRFEDIHTYLDYYLLENHTLNGDSVVDTSHLLPFFVAAEKPVFVVSYRNGIGYDSAYTQADLDAIWSDASVRGYSPCLKISEYVTRDTWHTLSLQTLRSPVPGYTSGSSPVHPSFLRHSLFVERGIMDILSRYYGSVLNRFYSHKYALMILGKTGVYAKALRSPKRFSLESWQKGEW